MPYVPIFFYSFTFRSFKRLKGKEVFEKFVQNETSACVRNEIKKFKLSLFVRKGYVATQNLGTHVPAATNTHKTIDELFNGLFSMLSVSDQRK
jgi:hypothetical protein